MSFSLAGFAISSVKLVINPVRPIILDNFAGGLSGSLRAQVMRTVGTPTEAYQIQRENAKEFDPPPEEDDEAVDPSNLSCCDARSFLAARRADLSFGVIDVGRTGRVKEAAASPNPR